MDIESFIVHAVSANLRDMKRALDWTLEDESRLNALDPYWIARRPLGAAYRFAQPFQKLPTVGWRPMENDHHLR
jgi:hypothetical protein